MDTKNMANSTDQGDNFEMIDKVDKKKMKRQSDDNNKHEVSYVHNIDLELQDVEGVGPTTAKKLKEAGITSVMELAVTTVEQLAVDTNSSKDSAAAFIMEHRNCLKNRMY